MTSMQKHTDINPETLTVKDLSIPQLDESQFHRPTVQDFKGDLRRFQTEVNCNGENKTKITR